ncbi:hypothetical protein RB195_018649 [Necator americanus]|uniref:Uncharacterized protein n=1 Tax=Necator americanus TaxID=51031 RepID=A0ABR1CAP9_NECAM
MQAGDMTIKGSSDELATEMQLREEKTCQTADESKREISIALKMWKETLEAENKKVCIPTELRDKGKNCKCKE